MPQDAPPGQPAQANADAPLLDLPPPVVTPSPAPSAFDQPITPAGSESQSQQAPDLGGSSSLFDPPSQSAAPSIFDAPPPDAEQAPPPFDPPAFDPPSFDAAPPPQQAPPGYDAPPAAPHQAAPAYDQPPAYDPPGLGPDQGGHGAVSGGGPIDAGITGIIGDSSGTTAFTDGAIQLSIDGDDYTFAPGAEITVGRDPSCLVAIDERHSLVSRRHLKVSHRDGSWWIEDFSSKGTFIDGRRVAGPYKAEGAFVAQLGDDDAGTPLRVITAGDHKSPRRQSIGLLLVIAVLAVIAIVAIIVLLTGDDGDAVEAGGPAAAETSDAPTSNAADSPTEQPDTAAAELAAAKQATVLLLAEGGGGLGSGFFVSDNLIVTNQHVAALAPTHLVAVSRETDMPAMFEYEASTVALHPFLDIAVLQLTGDITGSPVDVSGLQPASIGDSSALVLGDDVYSTGFPTNLSVISNDDMGDVLLPAVGTASGEAANFAIWPGCSNPSFESFIPEGSPAGVGCAPDGDIPRGMVITTFSSGQGASGSPVFRDGDVVAVVFAGPLDDPKAGRNITTSSFSGWLDEVIANNS